MSSAGIKSLDNERAEITGLVGELFAKPLGDSESRLRGKEFLGFVCDEILSHSHFEEEEMKSVNYHRFEEHKADHERISSYVKALQKQIDEDDKDDEDFIVLVSRLLGNWLVRHVNTYDHDLAEHLRAKRATP